MLAQFSIERAQRFIQKKQLGALYERSCQRDPLPLPSGELMWLATRNVVIFTISRICATASRFGAAESFSCSVRKPTFSQRSCAEKERMIGTSC